MGMIEDVGPPVTYGTVDVASRAKVDTGKVRRDINSGKVKANRLGRDFRFTQEQLIDALAYYRAIRKGRRNGAGTRRARPVTDA